MSKDPAITLWDRRFILLNLSFFLVFTNVAFLYLYPLALAHMGSERHVIGLVMGLFSLAAVISRPFLGKLISLKGENRVISAGLLTAFLSTLCYIPISKFGPILLMTRIIHGIGFSAFVAGAFSLAARDFDPKKRGEAFGILGAALMGAVALAPLLGEILIQIWGFNALFIAAATAMLLAWISVFPATVSLGGKFGECERRRTQHHPILKEKAFLFLLISTLIFAHCQATLPNFLALISAEKGVRAGRFFFVSYTAAILVLLFMGRAIDRYGRVRFMKLSYPVFSLGIFLVPWMLKAPFFPIPALMIGIGMGLLFPVHNALAAGHGGKNEKPAVMAVFTAVYDSGFITGAIVSGWLAHVTGLDTLFMVCGGLGLLGFLLVLLSPIREN